MANTSDYIEAFNAEVQGLRDPDADVRSGSVLNVMAGVNAVLFERQEVVADQVFAETSFDTAKERFNEICDQRVGERPREAILGTGRAYITRTTINSGVLYKGTRIEVVDPGTTTPRLVELVTDVAVAFGQKNIEADVRATTVGPAIPPRAGNFVDAVYGLTFTFTAASVSVGPGEQAETPEAFRKRKGEEKRAARIGFVSAIDQACRDAGAGQVVFFEAGEMNPTLWINRVFVSDTGYNSTTALTKACRLAVDSVAVGGADVMVDGFNNIALNISVKVRFWPNSTANLQIIERSTRDAYADFMSDPKRSFSFRYSDIETIIRGIAPQVKDVIVTSNTFEVTPGNMLNFSPIRRFYIRSFGVALATD